MATSSSFSLDDLEASGLPRDVVDSIRNFDGALRNVESLVSRLQSQPWSQLVGPNMPPLDSARLHLMIAYTINSLFWMYLRVQGINAHDHPVKAELDRVKKCLRKVKEAEAKASVSGAETATRGQPQPQPQMSLDAAAANRFIAAALGSGPSAAAAAASTPTAPSRSTDAAAESSAAAAATAAATSKPGSRRGAAGVPAALAGDYAAAVEASGEAAESARRDELAKVRHASICTQKEARVLAHRRRQHCLSSPDAT